MDDIKKRSAPQKTCAPNTLFLQDPSQFRELSQWDVELRQIEEGTMNSSVSVWAGLDLQMIDLSFDKAVYQTGVSRPDILAFGLPDKGSVRTWLNGSPSDTALMNFGSGDPFEGVSNSTLTGLTFGINIRRAQRIADDCGLDISTVRNDALRSFVSDAGKLHSLVKNKARFLIGSAAGPSSDSEESDMILELLEMLVVGEEWSDRRNSKNRTRLAQQAVEFMRAHLMDNVSIGEVCAEIQVSACTLRRAFQETYGVSPKQFYLRARLGAVRHELVSCSPEESISDIANAYGFWHMGQFARDYRALFGQLPTQTLSGKVN